MSKLSRYLELAADAKTRIREVTVEELELAPLSPSVVIIDVREKDEWNAGHAANAIHLSRGVIESVIEEKVPALDTPILCYCSGGNRSALVADNLTKMGYINVASIAGGFAQWQKLRLPVVPGGSNGMKL